MEPFTRMTGIVMPLDRANVDTDAIIPKQFLKSIHRTGFGQHLFDEMRYLDHGEAGQDCGSRPLAADFVLNQARYASASILLARRNFGCGSSREHAAWALRDYGFRVIIAPSFADIFYNNCTKNGILPVVLADKRVEWLFRQVEAEGGYRLAVDLPAQHVVAPCGESLHFPIDPFRKRALAQGLDEIAVTLERADAIRGYETWRRGQVPWLFGA